MAAAKKVVYVMTQEKVTKGAIRYGDGEGHSMYFRKEEVTANGLKDTIKVEISNK